MDMNTLSILDEISTEPSTTAFTSPYWVDSAYAKTHTQSKLTSIKNDNRNREYKIRRAAIGDNQTKEEMDAVVAYGLAQHRKNFPRLYSE